jgi:cystathionine beta-lyase
VVPALDFVPRVAAHAVVARPQRFFEQAGVGLSDGKDFGMEGYVRLNFACSRSVLDEALSRMQAALSTR